MQNGLVVLVMCVTSSKPFVDNCHLEPKLFRVVCSFPRTCSGCFCSRMPYARLGPSLALCKRAPPVQSGDTCLTLSHVRAFSLSSSA